MKRTWYTVKAAADSKPAVVSIFDDIGMWGVSAAAFIGDLRQHSGPLELEISSLGGSVFEGVAIYNALKRYAGTEGNSLTVTVMGVAASIASVIAMAGTTIRMPANTYMMVHKPWGGLAGNADEMRDYADLLDKIELSLVGTYMARTGKTEDEIKALLETDTWLTAAEAVEHGFADEVTDPIEVSASYEPERLPENVRALYGARAELKPPVDDEPPADDKPIEDADDASVFAADAAVLIQAAGLDAHAASIVLNASSLDGVKARIARASEITALCTVAKLPDEAGALIAADSTIAAARVHLIDALASRDDERRIDATPSNRDKPTSGVQPAAVTTAGIWAARRNSGVNK